MPVCQFESDLLVLTLVVKIILFNNFFSSYPFGDSLFFAFLRKLYKFTLKKAKKMCVYFNTTFKTSLRIKWGKTYLPPSISLRLYKFFSYFFISRFNIIVTPYYHFLNGYHHSSIQIIHATVLF